MECIGAGYPRFAEVGVVYDGVSSVVYDIPCHTDDFWRNKLIVAGLHIPGHEIPLQGGIYYVAVKHHVEGILVKIIQTHRGYYLYAPVCQVELTAAVELQYHNACVEIWLTDVEPLAVVEEVVVYVCNDHSRFVAHRMIPQWSDVGVDYDVPVEIQDFGHISRKGFEHCQTQICSFRPEALAVGQCIHFFLCHMDDVYSAVIIIF